MEDVQLMDGEFKFLIPLAKATEEDGKLYVEGIASDTGLDLHGEKISDKGQESMARWAKKGSVVLGGESNHWEIAFDDDLGKLVDGAVTDSAEFYIKALLDEDNPRASGLHAALKKGKQLGLSVFGRVTEFHQGDDGVPIIDGVALTRVMVTPSPANPRTWLECVAKSLPASGVAQGDGDDVAKAWDGSASNYEDTDAYCSACLMGVNAAAGRDEKVQSHCKLPVKQPGSDEYDFEGIQVAAGGYGITRIEKPDDVSDEDWGVALEMAANIIIAQYEANGAVAPVSVYEIVGEEPPGTAKSDVPELSDDQTEAGERAETPDVVAAALCQGNDGDPETVETATSDNGALATRQVLKGAFLDRLQQYTEQQEALAPFLEQVGRIGEVTALLDILWEVVYSLDWSQYDGEITWQDATALLIEAIDEFKAEVVSKSISNRLADEMDGDEGVDGAEEPEGLPLEIGGEDSVTTRGKSIREIAEMLAEEEVRELMGAVAPTTTPETRAHLVAQAAQMFGEAVKSVVTDASMTDEQRRMAVALAMTQTMDTVEQTLPAAKADDGLDGAPAWALALASKMDALEQRVNSNSVNVGAGSGGTSPGDADSPTLPARKSASPDIAASSVVQRSRTLRQIALSLIGYGEDDLSLP
jgi:hypothetical protein